MANDENDPSPPASLAPEPGGYDSAYASNNSEAAATKKRKRDDEPEMMGPPPRPVDTESISVQPPALVNPKSAYGMRPCPREKEDDILQDFLTRDSTDTDEEVDPEAFTEYFFENFTVYTAKDYQKRITPTSKKETYPFKYPWEMIRLSALKIAPHISWVLMDGFLVGADGERRWVERLKVDTLNVEYAEDLFAEPKIWVQSMSNSEIRERLAKPNRGRAQAGQPPIPFEDKRADTWYRLGTPSKEYRRYFEPFMWLASFGVFFQAFVDQLLDEGRDVTLLDFRQDFHEWLQESFEKHEDKSSVEVRFHEWMEAIGNATDFRNFVTSYKDWLWNQCYTDKERAGIALWGEVHVFTAIKPPYSGPHEMKTVVTPYVHSVFEDMYGDHLKKVAPVHEAPRKLVGAVVCKHKKLTGYKPQVGDCVAFAADDGGKWWKPEPETKHGKSKATENGWSDDIWFGYVTRIVGERVYIVWLYRPSDTILRGGKYPWPNELFFSDHCNCDAEAAPLWRKDILAKVDVVFRPNPEEMLKAEFFVRQKYRTEESAFHTIKPKDYELGRCACDEDSISEEESFAKFMSSYPPGSTVLYEPKGGELLEPGIVIGYGDKNMIVRQLPRLENMRKDAAPNEVVFTSMIIDVPPARVVRRCFIRVFKDLKSVTTPYDRGGIGDCFYIRFELNLGQFIPCRKLGDDELRQGYSLQEPLPKPVLKGMDLFCGGGNFGRGLEEGGAIEMKWAVDFDSVPLHNYRANLKDLGDTKLYLGSINNYLQDAIKGNFSEKKGIPKRDEVDFISAGSPCQGFSLANNFKNSEDALRKQSLVASLATAIDVYRPKYAVLENVAGIAHNRTNANGEEVNTYTVMLCAIVGLGYQAESFLADAWSHGNCQSRTRLILAITKEGYEPLSRPPRSHPHLPGTRQSALYEAPNGKKFGMREVEGLTPFRFCSVARCWGHLPHVGDAHVGMCIRYPDHISAANPDSTTRLLMSEVPRFDKFKSWRSAIESGRLHPALWTFPLVGEKKKETARTYSRVPRDGLCRTITTTPTPQCTRTGKWVHPDQNRLISVHEARIAQGYPDGDVLVGAPNKKLHVIGNSVARGVSLALGIGVREAYLKSDIDESSVADAAIEEIVDEDPIEVDDQTLDEQLHHTLDMVIREKEGEASGLNGTAYKKAATAPRSPFSAMFGSVVEGATSVVASAAAAVMGNTASDKETGAFGDADHPMIID